MRSRSGTVRRVHARHDRSKLRDIIGDEALRLTRRWRCSAAGGYA